MALFRKKYRQPYEAELVIIQAFKVPYTTTLIRNITQTKFSLGMSYYKDNLVSKIEPTLSKLQQVSGDDLVWDSYYAVLCINDGFKEEQIVYYLGRFLEAQRVAAEIREVLSQ